MSDTLTFGERSPKLNKMYARLRDYANERAEGLNKEINAATKYHPNLVSLFLDDKRCFLAAAKHFDSLIVADDAGEIGG